MHSHFKVSITVLWIFVLILVVMEDALAHRHSKIKGRGKFVLILVVMEDALALQCPTIVEMII